MVHKQQVWSGYNGNIYFEPMTIKRVVTAGSCGHDTEVENKSRGFALQRHATHRSSERRHQTADSNALRPLSWVKEKKSGVGFTIVHYSFIIIAIIIVSSPIQMHNITTVTKICDLLLFPGMC